MFAPVPSTSKNVHDAAGKGKGKQPLLTSNRQLPEQSGKFPKTESGCRTRCVK